MALFDEHRQGNGMKINDDVCSLQWEKLGSWFIGPSAENINDFCELAIETIRQNVKPPAYFPDDRELITSEVTSSKSYKQEMAKLKSELEYLNRTLTESIPLASFRYQGHMLSDPTIASRLGFLSAWMTNSNNGANEIGPVTSQLEIEVGKQLCDMIGFEMTHNPRGYIISGGSAANIEALWTSRNLKFFPLAVRKAIQNEVLLSNARDLRVYIPRLDRKEKIMNTSTWDLLNLDLDDVITLQQQIQTLVAKDSTDITAVISKYSLTNNGFMKFCQLHDFLAAPLVIASAANHFSWRKAATLLGIGDSNLICVPFDNKARMDLVVLQKLLDDCLLNKVPIIALGLNFYLLADAAWGGYYTTLFKKAHEGGTLLPEFPMNNYVKEQLSCLKYVDTVTVDPHKAGYCPYPSGSLCYRNGAMKLSLAFATGMLHSGGYANVNCFGIETSKPGSSSAGVYLSHRVIGLNRSGYGRILGQTILGAKLFYCAWYTLTNADDNFLCVPLIPIPDAHDGIIVKTFIRHRIIGKSYADIVSDTEVMEFLSNIGPDLSINAFAVNIKGNTSATTCNQLNMAVFNRLSHSDLKAKSVCDVPLFLTKSTIGQPGAGKLLQNFKERLQVSTESDGEIVFLKNTVMNPWTAADNTIQILVSEFRKVVMECISKITP